MRIIHPLTLLFGFTCIVYMASVNCCFAATKERLQTLEQLPVEMSVEPGLRQSRRPGFHMFGLPDPRHGVAEFRHYCIRHFIREVL